MSLLFFYPQKSYCHPALRDLLASRVRSAPSTARSAILAAKLQIFVDFGIGFGGKMLQEVANYLIFLLDKSESGGNIWKFRELFISLYQPRPMNYININ